MKPKEFFKLTAKTIDKQKTFFATKDQKTKVESIMLEDKIVSEIIRVAFIDAEIHDMIINECPWLKKKLELASKLIKSDDKERKSSSVPSKEREE